MAKLDRKTLSIGRLRAVLLVGLTVGFSLFTGVIFMLVGQLSERFGPEVRADLEWRVLRGAPELANAADVGLVTADPLLVTKAFGVYALSHDVQAIVAVDDHGAVVARHGDVPTSVRLFAGKPNVLDSSAGYLSSWAPAVIENVEVGKVAIVVSTRRLSEAEAQLSTVARITLGAGAVGMLLGVLAILLFTRALARRDRKLSNYANNLQQMVEFRTCELDERNREMRLVLDSVTQGFVMIDVGGRMASERSAIVDVWFGEPAPGATFMAFIEPHAAEFAAWFDLALGTIRDQLMPVELCITQMPTHLALPGGRTFEVGYRTIMNGDELERILVIVSDVTAELVRERSEREQRELLGMFQRITNDRTAVDEFMTEVGELLAILGAPCDIVVERRILHTLKGNCALFGLELYSELCHRIESELAESSRSVSDAQRLALVDGWRTVANWMGRLRGANRDDIVEIDTVELAHVIERAEQGISGPEIAAALSLWTLEPVARRFDRLAQHARGLARRLGKGELGVKIIDGGLRLDGARWSGFWAAAVHAVRNSIDHGIEPADERVELGKPESGLLTFIAEQAAGSIKLTIDDDGRGIDWDTIRERARSAGMPHSSHDDLVAALFADGVTTCDAVSETSGRGIGMAALQQAVLDLRGTIEVSTSRGAGTRICCRFPEVVDPKHATTRTRAANTRTYTSRLRIIGAASDAVIAT